MLGVHTGSVVGAWSAPTSPPPLLVLESASVPPTFLSPPSVPPFWSSPVSSLLGLSLPVSEVWFSPAVLMTESVPT